MKFSTECVKIPPHIQCATTLPWEMQIFKWQKLFRNYNITYKTRGVGTGGQGVHVPPLLWAVMWHVDHMVPLRSDLSCTMWSQCHNAPCHLPAAVLSYYNGWAVSRSSDIHRPRWRTRHSSVEWYVWNNNTMSSSKGGSDTRASSLLMHHRHYWNCWNPWQAVCGQCLRLLYQDSIPGSLLINHVHIQYWCNFVNLL